MLNTFLNNKKLKITNKINPSSEWVTLILCWLFAILFAVWLLPHTVAIRHGCLALGATLGLWVIFKNYRLLFQIRAIPILLLILLLAWVTLHLIFIGVDYENQLLEYTRIWKKIALGIPFGVGLRLA